MSLSKPLLVAAIDFGTAYSSWAYSFLHEYENDPTQISEKQWQGYESAKVDITVHEVLHSMDVKEVYKASGGAWGGTKVDEAFKDFMNEIAGFDAIADLKRKHLDDYIDMFHRFENKKRVISPDKDSKTVLSLPESLRSLIETRQGRALKDLIKDTSYSTSHVEIGQKLKIGDAQSTNRYHTLTTEQTSADFSIFTTYQKDPMYTTDPGCTRVGNLSVPISGSGLDRWASVRFIFGGTEIDVEATEESTGKVHHLKIDFLV
ncbi:HS12B-like protein [Mya arenaria]|uniref:HS12B-like protein n=1 Tax=Mya arenaria TaxID=6604 RepID=A0ABY7DAD2_MYAAR|nr:HS12B-like protein [Mya arenaria]